MVLDRAISTGGIGGPVCSEIKAALYQQAKRPKIISFIAGLGGRDLPPENFEEMVHQALKLKNKRKFEEFYTIGIRGIMQDSGIRNQESGKETSIPDSRFLNPDFFKGVHNG